MVVIVSDLPTFTRHIHRCILPTCSDNPERDDFVWRVASPEMANMAAARRQPLTAGMARDGVRMILKAALTSDLPHLPTGRDSLWASRAIRTNSLCNKKEQVLILEIVVYFFANVLELTKVCKYHSHR